MIDVGAIGAFGVGEHPQGGLFDRAAGGLHMRHSMGAQVVHLQRLIRLCGQKRRLGQKAGLKRQQIAENTGQRHHNVDTRTSQLSEGDQRRTAETPETVKPGLCADQRKGLPDRSAIGFDVVRAPEDQRNRPRQAIVGLQQKLRLTCPIAAGKLCWHAKGIKGMDVAPGGQDIRIADQIAAGHRGRKAPGQGMQQRGHFAVAPQCFGHICAALALGLGGVQIGVLGGFGQRGSKLVQTFRDQGLFGLQQPQPKPVWRSRQIDRGGLFSNERLEIRALFCVLGEGAPARQTVFQFCQPFI